MQIKKFNGKNNLILSTCSHERWFVRPTLKTCFLSPASQKKVTWAAGKTFFYLIQTKYYFLFQMLPSP